MNNKEYLWRREGMVYAYARIKEIGFEEFAKEMKRRGLLKIDLTISDEEVQKAYSKMADNMLNTMMPVIYSVLVDDFGFDNSKLKSLHRKFMKSVDNFLNLDYMGEHYVTLEDYQKYMNEEYGFDFDTSIGKECMSIADEDVHYHYAKIEKIIEELDNAGHSDASKFLREKVLL